MLIKTDWYDPGDGVWIAGTWTASVTACVAFHFVIVKRAYPVRAPAVATAIVSSGSIADYTAYISSADSAVLAGAVATGGTGGTGVGNGAQGRIGSASAGWTAFGVGILGAGLGAMVL